MNFFEYLDSSSFNYIILPLFIFFARIVDVTIGTLRILFISRNHKFLASFLAFFELLIWVTVIGQILKNINNFYCYLAYAGGFALGNFIGMCIEEKLAMGVVMLRVITRRDAAELIKSLKSKDYGVTNVKAKGRSGKRVDVIYIILKRSKLDNAIGVIRKFNPKAFFSIQDIRMMNAESFLERRPNSKKRQRKILKFLRKGK